MNRSKIVKFAGAALLTAALASSIAITPVSAINDKGIIETSYLSVSDDVKMDGTYTFKSNKTDENSYLVEEKEDNLLNSFKKVIVNGYIVKEEALDEKWNVKNYPEELKDFLAFLDNNVLSKVVYRIENKGLNRYILHFDKKLKCGDIVAESIVITSDGILFKKGDEFLAIIVDKKEAGIGYCKKAGEDGVIVVYEPSQNVCALQNIAYKDRYFLFLPIDKAWKKTSIDQYELKDDTDQLEFCKQLVRLYKNDVSLKNIRSNIISIAECSYLVNEPTKTNNNSQNKQSTNTKTEEKSNNEKKENIVIENSDNEIELNYGDIAKEELMTILASETNDNNINLKEYQGLIDILSKNGEVTPLMSSYIKRYLSNGYTFEEDVENTICSEDKKQYKILCVGYEALSYHHGDNFYLLSDGCILMSIKNGAYDDIKSLDIGYFPNHGIFYYYTITSNNEMSDRIEIRIDSEEKIKYVIQLINSMDDKTTIDDYIQKIEDLKKGLVLKLVD